MYRMLLASSALLMMLPSVASAELSFRSEPHPINVQIKMKEAFYLDEDVTGKIILKNSYASSLPATFVVRILHDKQIVSEHVMSIDSVPPWETVYSFQQFGLDGIKSSESSAGHWTIHIFPINRPDALSPQAEFDVYLNERKSDE